ncbi:hypothetical protein MA16_Dca017125 [Dendrobium catenatum]|uniref:Uncharacterized protein n=1 Tax=Dendrobium catenatum TaxID=906689 RepID=A0A2I0WAW8_9ASPA|nr:hypothetical protein MA16_Dca017125 [Dendrobium catenatum]
MLQLLHLHESENLFCWRAGNGTPIETYLKAKGTMWTDYMGLPISRNADWRLRTSAVFLILETSLLWFEIDLFARLLHVAVFVGGAEEEDDFSVYCIFFLRLLWVAYLDFLVGFFGGCDVAEARTLVILLVATSGVVHGVCCSSKQCCVNCHRNGRQPASATSSNHFPFTPSELPGIGMDTSAFDPAFTSNFETTGGLPDDGSRDSIRSLGQL